MTTTPPVPSAAAARLPGLQRWFVLPPVLRAEERRAFRDHLAAAACGGSAGGIVMMTDVILAKTLNVPGWEVTLLATLGPTANLASFYWAGQVYQRRKAGFFLLSGILGGLPLLVLPALARSSFPLIACSFLYSVAMALFITCGNSVFQARYSDASRPWCFGLAASVSSLFLMVSSQVAGILLSRNEEVYPWLFTAAGVAAVSAAYFMFRMEGPADEAKSVLDWLRIGAASIRRRLLPAQGALPPTGLKESLLLARKVMKENPDFVRFERNFMVYGFAFLSLLPVLPLYVVKELHMDYRQLSATKGIWSQVGLILLSPPLGIALGRLQPLRFTGRIFLLLALYPFCLWVSTHSRWTVRVDWVYAALLFYSFAMAGVNLSWTLGSMHFARGREASAFQGMHVALTGVRGLLAPSLGFLVYRTLGSGAAFALSTSLFALAGILMLKQYREESSPAG